MKKQRNPLPSFLLLGLAMAVAQFSFAQNPQIIPVSGSTNVPVSSTRTYSVNGNYGCLNWYVSNGTIQGSSTGNSIQVLWSSSPGNGTVTVLHFPSCAPSGPPTVMGYLNITITSPPGNCSGLTIGTCEWFQCMITQAYNGSGQSCAAVTATYNGILTAYPQLASCSINKHGCP